jgi:class 3 adenylate cyclase/phosphoglycerate-specific signal transduction histidine kinase
MTVTTAPADRPDGEGPRSSRRFGIRTKLFLAFLGFALLTVAASAVSWFVFSTIQYSVNRVTQDTVPGMLDALTLANTVTDISESAPALFASHNEEQLAEERAALDDDVKRFTRIAAALSRAGRYEEQERPVADNAVSLVAVLNDLAASVERRLDLQSRRHNVGVAAHEAHNRFNEILEPLVDDAVFDLVISGEDVMDDNTAAITSLVDNGISNIDRLLSINAAVNLAAGLMAEAIHVENPALLQPIRERFLSVALAIGRDLRQLPSNSETQALGRAIDKFLEPGGGQGNLFETRTEPGSLNSSPRTGGLDQQLSDQHESLLRLLTPMIDDAAFDLVMTTEAYTAKSEAAISGLIDGNAEIVTLVLTAQAEGNLVASLMSDTTVAPDETSIGPLEERFAAAEARLSGVLKAVEGDPSYDNLRDATDALLKLGSDDASIFALRRAELSETETGRLALENSRNLSHELSELVSKLVSAAEAATTEASASSARAINSAQIALVLITLVGISGAAIAMFWYVDPYIIRPIGRITSVMSQLAEGDTSVDIPGRDRTDELGDMARALGVFRDISIAVQEANLREIQTTRQRLADAIESISEGFSLYDSDDRLVISNRRYQQLLYPGMPEMIVPGATFRDLMTRAVEKGLITDALSDPEGWIADRLARRANPGPPHVQRRSSGLFIMVSEHKTADSGTVAVYSDITELKQREEELAKKSTELELLASQLAKYLSPQVYESIFTGRQEVKLASERKKLTIFFSDIVNFTSTAEKLQPEDLTLLLNEYLTEMAKIALEYGATIDKYVGDAIVIFFGDPESRGVQQDALYCVEMAIAMRDKMHELQGKWHDRGVENPLEIRIGINTGFCTVGNFGSEARMDYTIIGAAVNLASRLESSATHGGILISHETYHLVKDRVHCEAQEPITAKGISRPVATYHVVDTYERLGRQSDFMHAQQPNLHLEMNTGTMSDSEREEAEATLRQALERLSEATVDKKSDDLVGSGS